MNNDSQIQKINRLLAATRAGEIGISEGQLLTIQRNYLNSKALVGWKKQVPVFVFVAGLTLAALGSFLNPGHDSTSYHFDEYNQKLANGTNTRIDDMRADAESKMLEKNQDESRTPEMMFLIGVILCVVAPVVFVQFGRFQAKTKKEMNQVDDLISKLSAAQDQKSA